MKDRLISLDALRGFTIALMIIVNDPGSWDNTYGPLLPICSATALRQ